MLILCVFKSIVGYVFSVVFWFEYLYLLLGSSYSVSNICCIVLCLVLCGLVLRVFVLWFLILCVFNSACLKQVLCFKYRCFDTVLFSISVYVFNVVFLFRYNYFCLLFFCRILVSSMVCLYCVVIVLRFCMYSYFVVGYRVFSIVCLSIFCLKNTVFLYCFYVFSIVCVFFLNLCMFYCFCRIPFSRVVCFVLRCVCIVFLHVVRILFMCIVFLLKYLSFLLFLSYAVF